MNKQVTTNAMVDNQGKRYYIHYLYDNKGNVVLTNVSRLSTHPFRLN